jgi:hypothetical protein
MKKALIAAAVAGAFAAPSAMAAELSTNIYWSTAVGFGETTTTDAAGVGTGNDSTANNDEVLDGGGNRLMFTWTDTLDNGIGVSAYLSFGSLDTANAGGVSTRNANIGFSGDFGTVQIGANEHFSETDLIFDPSYGDFGATGDALSFIQVGQTGFNFTRRDGESIWWTSNNMNGLQARAVYIMGPQAITAAGVDPSGTQLGLTYTSGPLMVGVSQAAYEDYSADGAQTATVADPASTTGGLLANAGVAGSETKMTTIRGSYDMGMAMVKVARWTIEQTGFTNVGNDGNASGLEVEGSSIYVGMPVGGGTLWAQSSSLGDQDATTATGTAAIAGSGKSGFDVGFHMPMNANVVMFARYGESETDVNFDATAGSTETELLMFGWQLMY